MFKRNFYTCLLVVAGVFTAEFIYGQQDPTFDYSTLTGGINASVGGGYEVVYKVCPSQVGYPSSKTFEVSVNIDDYISIDDNEFEWVVFGGWITHVNNVAINPLSYEFSRLLYDDIRYSYLTYEGIANPSEPIPANWIANVTIEWDTTNFSTVNGWVAVRQTSEWSCSEGLWSVYRNPVYNTPPVFTTFPLNNIHLPYDRRNGYILPIPDVTDDGCNVSYPLLRSVTVENPAGTPIFYGDENAGNHTLNLQVGTNVVTWTVFDGSHRLSQSYNIIVEPALEILNVAWINPYCGTLALPAANGSALVTSITNFAFTGLLEYSFDGGTSWGAANSVSGLPAGAHSVQARLTYNVDIDSDGDVDEIVVQDALEVYDYELHAMATSAINAVPPEGSNAIVTDVQCLSLNNGKINIVDESLLVEQNNSVTFDGDDYLLLNKNYSAPLTSFSLSAWIKVPSAGNTEGTIISFDNEEFYQLSLIYWTTSGVARVRFQSTSTTGIDNEMFFHSKPVNDNQWHFVVATYNNGQHILYVDGEMQSQSGTYGTSAGSASDPRYGMIGARSETPDFLADPQTTFFKGRIAEIAIWDNMALTQANVLSYMKSGASGMSDRWVLNDIPALISPLQSDVFTDLGNNVTSTGWGRFYNCAISSGNSPKLYSYTDNHGGTINDYPSTADQNNLGEGTYTLHVRDIYGCGETTGNYIVENSDALPPEIYWNAAIGTGKTASQSSTNGANFASLAIDGFGANSSYTLNESEAWWEVNLGGIYPVRAVEIHPETDFSDFYVIAAQTAFTPGSTLAQDLAKAGVTSVHYPGATSGSTTIMITANALHVRIRVVGTTALHLKEVEVFTNLSTTPVRILYLGTACDYTITADEYSITPKVYDSCNGIQQFYNSRTGTSSLVGQHFQILPVGDETVTWTAVDDKPFTTTKDIVYRVVDNTPPVMNPLPFGGGSLTITYCESQSYNLLVPKISDNYMLSCDTLTSISLYSIIGGNEYRAYRFPSPLTNYNPLIDQYTGNLDYDNFLPAGDIVLEWRVIDRNNNMATDHLDLHVEREPRVLEVKASPITCNGSDNAQVTFSRIESEQNVNPAVNVIFILKSTVNPFPETTQTNNPIFNGVDPGSYQAIIEVNSCRSNPYFNIITIVNPAPVTATAIVTPVLCSGQANGGLTLTVSGGSQTDILHFLGGDNLGATVAPYTALNLLGTGTVEGWIYLDELIPGGINDDAGLFGVLNGSNAGYGFRMVDGVLTFYAGTYSVSAAAGAIAERRWYYIWGSWSETTGIISLSVDNGAPVTATTIPSGFTAPSGGTLYLGDMSSGDDTNNLRGFVRNVRIWNRVLTSTEIANNLYLLDPIDINGNIVANFPVATGGGTILQNRYPGGNPGNINTANYSWQKFAYYWVNSSSAYVARTKDLVNVIADDYTVTMQDPLGCNGNATFTIIINDTYKPTLTFSNNGYGIEPYLTVGEPIRRYTNATTGDVRNVTGDCLYYPSGKEFDPVIEDDVCPVADVDTTWRIISGAFGTADPPAAGIYSLNGVSMTDEVVLRWYATDQAGNEDSVDVTYYIIDNEDPVLTWSDQVRWTDDDDCGYTVTALDVAMQPNTTGENCITGRLYNNINGLDNLVGVRFEGGTTTNIRWTYEDKSYGAYYTGTSVSVERTLTVVDDQEPEANCRLTTLTAQLNSNGRYTLNALDINNTGDPSNDNCGALTALNVTRNVAYNQASVLQSTYNNGACFGSDALNAGVAVDGITSAVAACTSTLTTSQVNPYWQVYLGATPYIIYGIRIFSDDVVTLNNFWVVVSTDGNFCTTCNLTTPDWDGNVTYYEYYSGAAVPGSVTFSFPEAITGNYVRIWMNNPAGELSLTEVEVYGTTTPATASNILLGCNDVRYTPAGDTGTPGVWDDARGTFRNNGFMLTAIDDEGNTASCIADVNVQDNVPPYVIPGDVDVYLDDEGNISLNDYIDAIDNGSNDICGIAARWITPTEILTCINIGNYDNARLYVRDIYGNVEWEAAQNINIADNTPPDTTTRWNIQLPLDPDGVRTLTWSDIFVDVDDNCTEDGDLIINFNPPAVDCSDIGPLDLTVTITDEGGNITTGIFDADDVVVGRRVVVVDTLPPVATLSNFQLIIQEDGDSMIRFRDIIDPTTHLYDNCDKYLVPTKEIRYSIGGEWCTAGSEGTYSAGAFTNYATKSFNTVSASENQYLFPAVTYVVTNASDGFPSTAFISGSYTGERYIEYNFGADYQFNSTQVVWHEQTLQTNTPISQTQTSPVILVTQGSIGTPNGTFTIVRDIYHCKDGTGGNGGNYNDYYESSLGHSDNDVEDIWVQYDFGSNIIMNSTLVNWSSRPSSDFGPYIEWCPNGSDPLLLASWTRIATPIGRQSNDTDYTLNMGGVTARYVRIRCDRRSDRSLGIREWIINSVSGYNCILPTSTSTRLQYYNGTWNDVPGCETLDIEGTPSDNPCPFTNNILASRFRLYFNTSINGYVGIKEWRVFGREIPVAGNEACIKYYCNSVHQNVPVWLQWADNSSNFDSVQVDIPVEPYFDIKEIQIKDCGWYGERYYPFIDSLSEDVTSTFTWTEVDDGANQSLFEYSNGDNVPEGTPYVTTYPSENFAYLWTTNGDMPSAGTYEVALNVTDEHTCYDDYVYRFSYTSESEATSLKPWSACKGDIETFKVFFADQRSFWSQLDNIFTWVRDPNFVTEIEPSGSGYDSITVSFDHATTQTDIGYTYEGHRWTPNSYANIETYNDIPVDCRSGGYTCHQILGSATPNGPYWIGENETSTSWDPAVGTRYIRGPGSWAIDYGMCEEKVTYQTHVYEVISPVIYAYDDYNTDTWINAITLSVCPRDTIWYRVNNIVEGDYEYYDWKWTNGGVATGRRLDQGNWYDDSIQIVWDIYPTTPTLTVTGFNELDCSSTPTVITHTFTDHQGPILGTAGNCSSLSQSHANFSGTCEFTFTNLPPPVMTDNCRNRIASYYNNINGGTNAAGTYDVAGSPHTITWTALDYSGNDSTCSYTISVFDNEAPTIRTIIDTTIYADASCVRLFTGNKRDATFTENCDAGTVTLTADIFDDRTTNGVFNYQIANDRSSLNGFTFGSDSSYVVWTANDGRGNSSEKDFFVVKVDTTRPTISGIVNLDVPNDVGYCFADLTITPPGAAEIADNCTPDGSLVVEFTGRNDGAGDIGDPYPVGTTTITWRVSDTAIPPNRATAIQTVTVRDTQEPWFDNDLPGIDPALQDTSIGYCKRATHELRIPVPHDNCQVNRIDWSIVNVGGAAYTASGFITRAQSANFNPNGDGFTGVIPALPANAVTGSDYRVTWTVTDAATPVANSSTESYTYILHVEIEPYFNVAQPTPMSCGNANDGQITIVTSSNYRVEPGYDVDYTIYNWAPFQTDEWETPLVNEGNIFQNLSGGVYDVQMRVNGCFSEIRQATITQPEVYDITLTAIHPYCYEGTEGTIDLTMSGGVAGQVHFNGGAGLTANHYAELNLTSQGSIEAWVYLESLTDARLVSKGTDYALRLYGGKFTIDVNGAFLGDSPTEGVGMTPLLRRWYYVAGTWNTGTGTMQLFVEEVNQSGGSTQIRGTLSDAPTNPSNVTVGNSFNGIIREVRIWNNVVDGSIPTTKYTGGETNIQAFWPMDFGSGNTASNSCSSKNGNATALTGATSLWDNNEPQLGTYTWTSDWGLNTTNYIDLTGLRRGVYTVAFQDPYSCPADPGLVRSFTLIPTDAQKPAIAEMPNTTLNVDPGNDCQRIITALEADGLRPAITDACIIESITWQITPERTLVPQFFTGNNFAGGVLELGRNRVDVTAYQYNSTISQSSFYYINVVDNIPPEADGLSITDGYLSNDYTPMGSGIVYYDAFGFNEASGDNCSTVQHLTFKLWNGTEWADELSFDCLGLNQAIPVRFRVTDEAGLSDIEEGNTITILDQYDPVFIGNQRPHQACAAVDATDPEPDYVIIPEGFLRLDASDYSDNCNVTTVEYSLDHATYDAGDVDFTAGDDPGIDNNKFYVGETAVWFRIVDSSGNDAISVMYNVTVLPKPSPQGIN